MSKSSKNRCRETKPSSSVDPAMLAIYRRAAQAPSQQEEVRTLTGVIADYKTLTMAGDLNHALGAGLALVDLGLRIAATPSENAVQLQSKTDFFDRHFGSMTSSFDHGHVARIAEAVVAAERAWGRTPSCR